MAIDPVRNMEVNEETALAARRDGKTYYFCSENCRQKFGNVDATPLVDAQTGSGESCCALDRGHDKEHSDAKSSKTSDAGTALYICPMCPEVESEKPGSCSKCGMALERANPVGASSKTIYTCPMHPEIEQDGPGDCPICGMRLEPKTVTQDSEVEHRSSESLIKLLAGSCQL